MANRINRLSEWEYTESPLAWLLSQPFIATAEANEALMEEQISLVVQFCFTKAPNPSGRDDEPSLYEPVMIPMTITRGYVTAGKDPSLREESLEILVPLITLMPLSPIVINDVDVQFSLDITSQQTSSKKRFSLRERQKKEHNESSRNNSVRSRETVMHASLSAKTTRVNGVGHGKNIKTSEQPQPGNSGSLHMRMNARSIPLPPGLGAIIDAYSNSIVPLDKVNRE